jgi:thiamine pyrophosphate-dependent acetolactate synthase large subunit-like protein
MTTFATAAARALAAGGVRQAFGVVGNGNVYAVDALIASGVSYLPARHEGGAIVMADAYYRTTGEVAVCTTTWGPGLTNVATGLADAVKHGSGVLLLCGDRPAFQPGRPTDIDQSAFVGALGAEEVRLTDPATVWAGTAAALRRARQGRRPVVLSLPDDLLNTEVPGGPAGPASEPSTRVWPSAIGIEAALDVLAGARRPLLLAGLGAWRAGAAQPLAALADRIGALVATTVMADGLFAGHDWSLGICGGFASPRAAEIIGRADTVVAFGTSLNNFTLHGGRLIDPHATVVRVDLPGVRPAGRVDLEVTGDAAAAAVKLLDGVRRRGLPASGWRAEVGPDIGRTGWALQPYEDASTDRLIDPRTLSRELAGLLPPDRTLVTDGGHFVGWPIMYWPVPDPAALVFTGAAFMGIGLGFAGAVGAAVGRPDRTTVVALGDGGALMGLPELETLVREVKSALVVIYNDAAYGWEVHTYGDVAGDQRPMTFPDTDFAAVARALGAAAVTVRTPGDLAAVGVWRDRGCPGTLVLDCKIVPTVVAGYLTDLRPQLRAGGTPVPAPALAG